MVHSEQRQKVYHAQLTITSIRILPLHAMSLYFPYHHEAAVLRPQRIRCRSKCIMYIVLVLIMLDTHFAYPTRHAEPDAPVSIDAPYVSRAFVNDFNRAVKKGIPLLVPRATLRTSFERLQEAKWTEGLILSAFPALYGAPHLIGWFAVFPTTWERIAWRVSSLMVMGSGLAAFVLFGAVALVRWAKDRIKNLKYYDRRTRPYGSLPIGTSPLLV